MSDGMPSNSATAVARTALAVRGLCKSFAGTQALDHFELELREGEVHALVGGNGSGKSTLIKILAGVYQADDGELERGTKTSSLTQQTPAGAKAQGLRFVHQDLGIVPILSVAENLALGQSYPTSSVAGIRWRALRADARATLARFHVDADPSSPAGSLSTPQRAMLAIARALQTIDADELGVLVLDEPTASLPPEEATLLLKAVRKVADEGHTVLLVTHRLDEVQRTADRVTGLRDGCLAGTAEAQTMTEGDIVQLILGRALETAPVARRSGVRGTPVLEVRGVGGGPLRDVSLTVAPGEVVGIAGLLGSGRTELLEMIFGARRYTSGEILVDGQTVPAPRPGRMRARGVAFVPENRQAEAVFPDQTVAQNMTAGRSQRYFRRGFMRDRALLREVGQDVQRFHIRTASVGARIETLSGGNQQKVILARWLRDQPKVILLDEPTQGIDIGAREEIFALINEASRRGAAVVLVSSEFEELTRLSHRIAVLSDGGIVEQLGAGVSSQHVLQTVLEHARSLRT
jgi:ribose transport system ATP-binding protein